MDTENEGDPTKEERPAARWMAIRSVENTWKHKQPPRPPRTPSGGQPQAETTPPPAADIPPPAASTPTLFKKNNMFDSSSDDSQAPSSDESLWSPSGQSLAPPPSTEAGTDRESEDTFRHADPPKKPKTPMRAPSRRAARTPKMSAAEFKFILKFNRTNNLLYEKLRDSIKQHMCEKNIMHRTQAGSEAWGGLIQWTLNHEYMRHLDTKATTEDDPIYQAAHHLCLNCSKVNLHTQRNLESLMSKRGKTARRKKDAGRKEAGKRKMFQVSIGDAARKKIRSETPETPLPRRITRASTKTMRKNALEPTQASPQHYGDTSEPSAFTTSQDTPTPSSNPHGAHDTVDIHEVPAAPSGPLFHTTPEPSPPTGAHDTHNTPVPASGSYVAACSVNACLFASPAPNISDTHDTPSIPPPDAVDSTRSAAPPTIRVQVRIYDTTIEPKNESLSGPAVIDTYLAKLAVVGERECFEDLQRVSSKHIPKERVIARVLGELGNAGTARPEFVRLSDPEELWVWVEMNSTHTQPLKIAVLLGSLPPAFDDDEPPTRRERHATRLKDSLHYRN